MKKLSKAIDNIPGEYIPLVGVALVSVIVMAVHFLMFPLF